MGSGRCEPQSRADEFQMAGTCQPFPLMEGLINNPACEGGGGSSSEKMHPAISFFEVPNVCWSALWRKATQKSGFATQGRLA